MSVVNETSSSVVVGIVESWKRFGIFDVVLPFLLVFSVLYGVLGRTKIFGDKGPAVNAVIAFTIAMTSVLTGWFISFLTGFLPWVSIISIVIICAFMLIAMFANDLESMLAGKHVLTIGAVVVGGALGVVLIGMAMQGSMIDLSIDKLLTSIGLSTVDLWGIVFFFAFIAVIYIIGRTPKSGGGSSGAGGGSSG